MNLCLTQKRLQLAPWLIFFCALIMTFMFQGSRGLWDPDEGRYSNVALQMIDSGDYLTPHRHHHALHVTKPPLTYWAIAASVNVLGRSEWALRLPMALAFILTVMLVYSLGRTFVPEAPWLPALIYLGCPLPYLASNVITTDTLLTCAETAAVLAYVRFRFTASSPRWLDIMWALFGIAFMIKGPPALLALLAITAWEFRQRSLSVLIRPLGLLAFALIGLSWFAWIIHRNPELLSYFLGHEVVGRIASSEHNRHGEWYGGLIVYLPTLALGALPWSVLALGRYWRTPELSTLPSNAAFLWLWIGLPLVVFFLAQSRLPFYLLPIFVPLSLLLGQSLADLKPTRNHAILTALWFVLLVTIKALSAHAPSHQDARLLANELKKVFPSPVRELVFVETEARYGLNYYLNAEIEKISLEELPKHRILSSSYDDDLKQELNENEKGVFFLVQLTKAALFSTSVRSLRFQPHQLGKVHDLAIFSVTNPINDP